MKKALAVLVALALVAVGAGVAIGNHSGPKPGTLSASYSFDTSRGMPVEGTVSYVVVRRRPGGRVLRAELAGDLHTRAVTTPLRAGRYRLSAYQRLCVANCDNLDAASHGCGRDLRVGPGARVRARIHVRFTAANLEDQPRCQISVR